MNTSSSHQILLIGLPNTGKTSYLAALWYMVNQSNVECRLSLERLDGNFKYLNEICNAWSEYRPVTRNLLDSEKVVSMELKDRETGRAVRLIFPDLSGESFRLQWTARQLTSGYDEQLRKASGGILFVHPDGIVKPTRIDAVNDLIAVVSAGNPERGSVSETSPVETKPWDSEKAPTQVQLMELLQFISSREYFRPPFRLAIVVSAWDLVVALDETPLEWVSAQLPLLRQFLDCNWQSFDVAFYGVSAQGGRYASSLFSAGDFKNGCDLVKRLHQKADPVSSWLWEQFDEAVREALWDSRSKEPKASETLEPLLVHTFNKFIAKANLYDQGRFANVKLRSETKDLLEITGLTTTSAQRRQEETVRLNRLLLEDTYTSELSGNRQNDREVSELVLKTPARRALLVGDNVKNFNDITEPLQWLMH